MEPQCIMYLKSLHLQNLISQIISINIKTPNLLYLTIFQHLEMSLATKWRARIRGQMWNGGQALTIYQVVQCMTILEIRTKPEKLAKETFHNLKLFCSQYQTPVRSHNYNMSWKEFVEINVSLYKHHHLYCLLISLSVSCYYNKVYLSYSHVSI